MNIVDFQNINNVDQLKGYLVYTIKSYQSLAERYMDLNNQLITQIANNQIYAMEMDEKESHVKRLKEEIINLYRELGETKYQMSINIDELIPEKDDQLCFEFVDGYTITKNIKDTKDTCLQVFPH